MPVAARCQGCGAPIEQAPMGRPRLYCSKACGARYRSPPCVDCGRDLRRLSKASRCRDCANVARIQWTAAAITAAIQRWALEHDGRPPSATDWLGAMSGTGYPGVPTVQAEFGSWSHAIECAGFEPLLPGHRRGRVLAPAGAG